MSTLDTIDLVIADFEAEWGVVDLGRYRGRLRDHDDERFLAQYAQLLRCERVALGGREETSAFFAEGPFRGGVGDERRLRAKDWARERRLEAAYGREQPAVHGTASGFAACAPKGARRCEACRAYQRERSRANRADRLARGLCTGTRSSYDAGCRCSRCSAANSSGCARWRAGRLDQVQKVAA
jgi:hypothetical protein